MCVCAHSPLGLLRLPQLLDALAVGLERRLRDLLDAFPLRHQGLGDVR